MAKISTLIADIAFMLANIILLILLIVSFVKLNNSNYTYIHSVGENWRLGPLISINSEGKCEAGQIPIITDFWPGTNAGCYCPGAYPIVEPGTCSRDDDTTYLCLDVLPTSPIHYQKWRGKDFCGERSQDNYLKLTLRSDQRSCPLNTKPCGEIDSLKNVLCLSDKIQCPINELKAIEASLPVPKDKNYTVLEANNAKILASNENLNGKIIVDFSVQDDQPCADTDYKNLIAETYPLNPFYKKSKCTSKIGNFTNDNRYFKIDNYGSFDIQNENYIYRVTNGLPLYPDQLKANHTTTLYARNYVGVKPNCLNEIQSAGNSDKILSSLLDVKSNIISGMTFSGFAMGVSILCTLFLIAFIILFFIKFDESEKVRFYIGSIPIGIGNLVIFILCCVAISKISDYVNFDNILAKQDCVDELTYLASQNFSSNISSSNGSLIFTLIMCVISMIIIIFQAYTSFC
jgi:hypothetical protein